MKTICVFLLFILLCVNNFVVYPQHAIEYNEPTKEIKELINYEKSPSVSLDKRNKIMVLLYSNTYNTVEELAQEGATNLAGLEINNDKKNYVDDIRYKIIGRDELIQIEGLPENARLSYFVWSPDQTKIAFMNTTNENNELWYYDFDINKLFFVVKMDFNSNTERPFHWFKDGKSFLAKCYSSESKYVDKRAKTANPTVYFNDDSTVKRAKTYANLLKNYNDELNFEKAISSELYEISLEGQMKLWKKEDSYINISFSPNREYILITTLLKPYSYKVPYTRFQQIVKVYDRKGNIVTEVEHKPTMENLPRGLSVVSLGKRFLSWRSDKPASLFWVEALDGGDPQNEIEYRDELFLWDAPFTNLPRSILKVKDRFNKILWGNDNKAVIYTVWMKTRNVKSLLFSPSDLSFTPVILEDRNYQDVNSSPGSFDLKLNEFNHPILNLKGDIAYLIGKKTDENKRISFIDELNLYSLDRKRVFESDLDGNVDIISINDIDKGDIIICSESRTKYPNYYLYNINRKKLLPLTDFPNPFKSIEKVNKKVISYMRSDGVSLSGILYLPAKYNYEKKERLPLIIWAYPQDYIDKRSANQPTSGENEFSYLNFPSPVYWVTKGFAVFDNVTFPIIGEGKNYPNDTFIEQLILNAEAAIGVLDSLGYIDNKKIAVAGHSYGAFMVANLLTHSDLFSAGIALSGAYNRTLTPFGFQNEERTYWDAPQLYDKLSPFMHADRMKYPLLLIHGEKDSNMGTSVIQSERYYDALNSLGATTRLVILPYEDHYYKAYESIMHASWEIDQWLEKYVR